MLNAARPPPPTPPHKGEGSRQRPTFAARNAIKPAMLRRLAAALILLAAAGVPAFAQDAADLVVRLTRMENQMRQMAGQIEQLQFENRQLKEQVRRFQEDVEFRFQEGRGGAVRSPSAAPPAATPGVPAGNPGAAPARPGATPGANPGANPAQRRSDPVEPPPGQPVQRRSDAFDPTLAPDAPGAPRPLGSTPPSAPLPGGALAEAEPDDELPPGVTPPLDLAQAGRAPVAPPPAQGGVPRSGPSVAATGSGDPRADYDGAYAFLLQKQYEQAEMGFRRFLQSHPRDRLVPDATFWLGETYLQRNRHREAAEQFLTVSTEHSGSQKAPDALLKLGISLNALGARDRACAVFAELDRKYPQAAPTVRQASDREQKRARCV